jgi:hypothetical protein
VRYETRTQAQAKADRLKSTSLLLAATCRAEGPDSLTATRALLDSDLDKYEELLDQAGEDSVQVRTSRFALENQFQADGCYPTFQIPKAVRRTKKTPTRPPSSAAED